MRKALRQIGWVGLGLALAGFFFVLWASLQLRQAVSDGALTQPVWTCISRSDADRLDQLPNRAFVRAIQQHLAANGSNSTFWHWNGLIAIIGAQTSYSANERERAMRPQLASLPACQDRGMR